MSQVTAATALLVFVTLTRGLGQSALSVVSLAMVGKWFRRRLTWAMGVYALSMSVGFMLAFPARRRARARERLARGLGGDRRRADCRPRAARVAARALDAGEHRRRRWTAARG